MISSFTSFSQTITGDITPDKVVKDTTLSKTYWMWETPKAKIIAKELEKGIINAEKVEILEKKIYILIEKDKVCENITDSLKLANSKANEIIEKQEQIINNDNQMIAKHEEISSKKDDIIEKQDRKIKRKSNTIKTLIGTNAGLLVVLLILL
jgi:hypothetical protein